jgi:kynurenine formamidase
LKVVDLSWKYTHKIRVFEGGIPPVIRKEGDTSAGDVLELTYIENFCMHYGTHLDCPGHFISGGFHVDDKPVSFYMGEGIVVDCSGYGEGTKYGMEVLDGVDLAGKDFVLFHINWAKNWDKPEQYGPYPVMTDEMARHMASLDIKGIGVETNNVDTMGDTDFPIHTNFLKCNNKVLYEALTNLDLLVSKEFSFVGLPLNVQAGEGAPVRAVALVRQ